MNIFSFHKTTRENATMSDEPLIVNSLSFGDMNDLIRQRLLKLKQLQDGGMNVFGERFEGITSITAVRAAYAEAKAKMPPPPPEPPPPPPPEGTEPAGRQPHVAPPEPGLKLRIAGRLMAMRKMGGSIFSDLQDQDGRIQLFANKNVMGPEAFEIFKHFDIGDIIGVDGEVFTTRTGEVSVRIESWKLLSKSLRPFPEKFHGLTDVQERYRQRYVDLVMNEDSRNTFKKRAKIIAEIRNFLISKGYLEVETPMMQPIPGGAQARPFKTFYNALDCEMYMRIAPELYLKRLIVGGLEKVFEINRNFRNEGLSRKHNPEFTALEVYESYGDCRSMMELIEEMICHVAMQVNGSLLVPRENGEPINLQRPSRRIAYHELVRDYMGAEWHTLPIEARRVKATLKGLDIPLNFGSEEVDHEIYGKLIEPTLVQPTFVTRLPKHLVPLAKHCSDNPALVDVFELACNGQEIAPGYSELNDPIEQRQRFNAQIAATRGSAEAAEVSEVIDEDFLRAMEYGMPPTGGMGLGIDRLVMFLTNSQTIRDVILFPQLRTTGE
jgi:lysyl-tRNA synthetase class 2